MPIGDTLVCLKWHCQENSFSLWSKNFPSFISFIVGWSERGEDVWDDEREDDVSKLFHVDVPQLQGKYRPIFTTRASIQAISLCFRKVAFWIWIEQRKEFFDTCNILICQSY